MTITYVPPPQSADPLKSAAERVGKKFRNDIEGLRAIAIVLVVLSHAGVPPVIGGYVGVDVFFVISGFLITSMLLREYDERGRVSLIIFYGRRVARLLPMALLVVLLTAAASYTWLSPLMSGKFALDSVASTFSASNLIFAALGTDYLAADVNFSPFQQFWSLAVEEQFYMAWPAVFVAASLLGRRTGKRHGKFFIVCSLLAVTLMSFLFSVTETHRSAPWAYFGTHTRAWELGAGGLLAVSSGLIAKIPGRLAVLIGWLGFALVSGAATAFDLDTKYPGALAVIPVAGTIAIIASGQISQPWSINRALEIRPMQTVGRLSYSWYLWHWPIIMVAPVALDLSPSTTNKVWLSVAALGLAWLSYHLVENPFRHSRSAKKHPARVVAVGITTAAIAIAPVALVLYLIPQPIQYGLPAPGLAAKLHNTPNFEHVITEEIRTSKNRSSIPANLQPALDEAQSDMPLIYREGCHVEAAAIRPKPGCEFGDLDSQTTVVLLGDSHAAQWFPALERIALRRNWKLVAMTKSSCSVADISIWNPTLRREYTECNEWRANAQLAIARLKPAAIFVSSLSTYRVNDNANATVDQWLGAWRRTFDRLGSNSTSVVAFADTPTLGLSAPLCLSMHPTSTQACNVPPDATFGQHQRTALLRLKLKERQSVIDPTSWLCTTLCPSIIDDTLVYRDATHLSTVMSIALTPGIEGELSRAFSGHPIDRPRNQ